MACLPVNNNSNSNNYNNNNSNNNSSNNNSNGNKKNSCSVFRANTALDMESNQF